MNDLISRQAAIDAIETISESFDANGQYDERTGAEWTKAVIVGLPSAQRWIPCSERLPDEGCEVLVSAWTGEVGLGTWHEGENAFWRLDTNITVNMANIIAWMPLPKPYKEDEE